MRRTCETVTSRYQLPDKMWAIVCEQGEVRSLFALRASAIWHNGECKTVCTAHPTSRCHVEAVSFVDDDAASLALSEAVRP